MKEWSWGMRERAERAGMGWTRGVVCIGEAT